MVVSRETVRRAVERAMLLDPASDVEAAIAATAQSLALPVETVRECVQQVGAAC